MKEKILNIVDKIGYVMLLIVAVLINIFVGFRSKQPIFGIEVFVIIFGTIYCIINLICNKKKIIRNKLDILVYILCFSLLIPLIFGKLSSVSDNYDYMIKLLLVLNIYILIRNIVNTPKRKEMLLSVIIWSSLVLIIIGIDTVSFKATTKYFEYIDAIPPYATQSNFMLSLYCSGNALTAHLGVVLLLTTYKLIKVANRYIKALYQVLISLIVICLYMAMSRAGIVMLMLIYIIYMLCMKNKENNIKTIVCLIESLIILGIYIVLTSIIHIDLAWKIVISIAICMIASYLFNLVINHFMDSILKVSIKKVIIVVITTIILGTIYILIGLKYSSPASISGFKSFNINNVKPSTTYKITLDMETIKNDGNGKVDRTKYNNEGYEKYNINIIEHNIYDKENYIITEKMTGFTGSKTYEIKTSEAAYLLEIKISPVNGEKVLLKKVYVNGEEYIVNYKYIPNMIARMVTSFNSGTKSIWQRVDYYKDAFTIIKSNWLTGQGGGTWENTYRTIQAYDYYTRESHSMVLDMFMNAGIVGGVTYLLIITYIIYLIVRQIIGKKSSTYANTILMALIFLIMHSMMDIDSGYLSIYILLFILLGLNVNEAEGIYIKELKNKIYNVLYYIIIIWLILCGCLASYFRSIEYYDSIFHQTKIFCYTDHKNYKTNVSNKIKYAPFNKEARCNNIKDLAENSKTLEDICKTLNVALKFCKEEPYYSQVYIQQLLLEQSIKCYNMDKAKGKEYIYKVYDTIKDIPMIVRYNFSSYVTRATNYKECIIQLDNILKDEKDLKLAKIREDMYSTIVNRRKTMEQIIDKKGSYTDKDNKIKEYISQYDNIIKSI